MPAATTVPAEILADPANRWITLIQPAADLARQIADTDFVPTEMRGKPAVIAACILYGNELGLAPMMSLAKIDVVKGRPAPRAELARALALAAGHELWVEESTNTRVVLKGRRRGSDHLFTVAWTMDDVRKACVASHMYAKYPRQMLLARASAELVRQMAPDALGGIAQFAEELDGPDTATEAPEPAARTQPADTPAATTTTRRRRTPAPPPRAAEPDEPAVDEPPVDEHEGPTEQQIKKLMATFNDLGIKAKPDRLAFIAAACRPVESSKDLTRAEAGTVIDAAESVARGTLLMTIDDGTIVLTPNDDGTGELPLLPHEDHDR